MPFEVVDLPVGWFKALKPDPRQPATALLLLCEGDLNDVRPQVLAAARQFAAVG